MEVVGVNQCSEIPFDNILNHCRVRQDIQLFSVLCLGPFFYSLILSFPVVTDGHLVNIKTEQWIILFFGNRRAAKKTGQNRTV